MYKTTIITKRVNSSSLFFLFPNTEAVPQKKKNPSRKTDQGLFLLFSFPLLFFCFSLFILCSCRVCSHCISTSPEESTVLSYSSSSNNNQNKKKRSQHPLYMSRLPQKRLLSVTDINTCSECFEDCPTVLFSSCSSTRLTTSLPPPTPPSPLCKMGEREKKKDKIYL